MPIFLSPLFQSIVEFFKFGESLSPAMNQLIEAAIPAEQQREMKRRLRSCKHYCKFNKLSYPSIVTTVNLLFKDLSISDDNGIALLMAEELHVKTS